MYIGNIKRNSNIYSALSFKMQNEALGNYYYFIIIVVVHPNGPKNIIILFILLE
ncbi:uncharacterized protein BX663DRAFT_508548 [Cokeromyces recurvatus]|uniref:uncharacterized protein n=1 Tax=Cokeromyces recurvatus TaxID=90255 RepID=UPI00221E4A9E|nr:uncharacterized protein BX663DRAFT_508548 [Cokeromyces recurvatus]KAI7903423.1 hypothetical protein BX663DRAFT_508548 [Cokeromyces recurvatus]